MYKPLLLAFHFCDVAILRGQALAQNGPFEHRFRVILVSVESEGASLGGVKTVCVRLNCRSGVGLVSRLLGLGLAPTSEKM
jgi:hypothetical protein